MADINAIAAADAAVNAHAELEAALTEIKDGLRIILENKRISIPLKARPTEKSSATQDERENQCSICYEPLVDTDGPPVVKLKRCGHAMHVDCGVDAMFVQWRKWTANAVLTLARFQAALTCSTCRVPIFNGKKGASENTKVQLNCAKRQNMMVEVNQKFDALMDDRVAPTLELAWVEDDDEEDDFDAESCPEPVARPRSATF
ncbi:hypothetical protein BU23DRAFT_567720 [Bimuria novae-zelandiae CBS 107.79]|uniref:RING-type domain-containing protein n=1 Tax=Bimuria novae-zelandiae CBS 107.79 TaxID=1447943 RepID=A0A6A5VGM3_9PLEO|nr:hypothetical protein BU23DRAFT_567720 [Bimuria novae-zelandiae CBS 107.79]